MPCYHPIPGNKEFDARTGKTRVKLHATGEPDIWLPCGKCLGCREVTQQQLALRITHEARYHDGNHFLTLTYDEEKCPIGLSKRHMQLMWKRTRKAFGAGIKHLTCGEYGDRTQRPHYHAAVLGLAVNDLKKWDSENHTSETLTKLWGNGIVTVSELTEARVQYVAGYVLKKAGYRRQTYCDEDGVELESPFRLMSKGLGKRWIDQYQNDLRLGYLQHNGAKYSIPRYYADRIKQNEQLNQYIQNEKSKNWKQLTDENRKCLHNAEKIRQQQIREKRREAI